MAYLCVDQDGTNVIFDERPERDRKMWAYYTTIDGALINFRIDLPKGSVEKLIGRTLTWNDEPVAIY